MLDFPASPTNGQLFAGANGVVYQWNAAGGLWLNYGVGTNNAIVSSTPPANPVAGMLWWSPDLGQLFIWYVDANSSQWVSAAPAIIQPSWRSISNQTVVAQPFIDVTGIPADINHLQVHFDCTPSVNDVDLALNFYNGAGVLENSSGQYLFANYETNNTLAIGNPGGASSSTSSGNSSTIILDWSQATNRVGNAAGNSIAGDFRIPNIRDATKQKKVQYQSSYINGNSNIFMCVYGSGIRQNATVLTGFRLLFGSGSNISGNVEVWGSP